MRWGGGVSERKIDGNFKLENFFFILGFLSARGWWKKVSDRIIHDEKKNQNQAMKVKQWGKNELTMGKYSTGIYFRNERAKST